MTAANGIDETPNGLMIVLVVGLGLDIVEGDIWRAIGIDELALEFCHDEVDILAGELPYLSRDSLNQHVRFAIGTELVLAAAPGFALDIARRYSGYRFAPAVRCCDDNWKCPDLRQNEVLERHILCHYARSGDRDKNRNNPEQRPHAESSACLQLQPASNHRLAIRTAPAELNDRSVLLHGHCSLRPVLVSRQHPDVLSSDLVALSEAR